MKRSPMPGRRAPMPRGDGLARSSSSLDRSPLRRRSKTRSAFMAADRVPLIELLEASGVTCEIGPLLARAGVTPWRCRHIVQGLHERRKRSSAGSLTVAANLIPACNWCNGWIEDTLGQLVADDPRRMTVIGRLLVVREGDPEWEALGRRATGAALTVHRCATCREPYAQIAPCGHENRLRDT